MKDDLFKSIITKNKFNKGFPVSNVCADLLR